MSSPGLYAAVQAAGSLQAEPMALGTPEMFPVAAAAGAEPAPSSQEPWWQRMQGSQVVQDQPVSSQQSEVGVSVYAELDRLWGYFDHDPDFVVEGPAIERGRWPGQFSLGRPSTQDTVLLALQAFIRTDAQGRFTFPAVFPGARWGAAFPAPEPFAATLMAVLRKENERRRSQVDNEGIIPALLVAMTKVPAEQENRRILRRAINYYAQKYADRWEIVMKLIDTKAAGFAAFLARADNSALLDLPTFDALIQRLVPANIDRVDNLPFLDYARALTAWRNAGKAAREARAQASAEASQRDERYGISTYGPIVHDAPRLLEMWDHAIADPLAYARAVRETLPWIALEKLVGVKALDTAPVTALYAEVVHEAAAQDPPIVMRDSHSVLLTMLWKALPAWLKRFSGIKVDAQGLDFLRDPLPEDAVRPMLALISSLIFFKGQLPSEDPLILLLAHSFYANNYDLFSFGKTVTIEGKGGRGNPLIGRVEKYAAAFAFMQPSDALAEADASFTAYEREKGETPKAYNIDHFGPYEREGKDTKITIGKISRNYKQFLQPAAQTLKGMQPLWAAFAGDEAARFPTYHLVLDAVFAPPTDTIRTLCAALRRFAQLHADIVLPDDPDDRMQFERRFCTDGELLHALGEHFFADIAHPIVAERNDARYTTAQVFYAMHHGDGSVYFEAREILRTHLRAVAAGEDLVVHPTLRRHFVGDALSVLAAARENVIALHDADRAGENIRVILSRMAEAQDAMRPEDWQTAIGDALLVPLADMRELLGELVGARFTAQVFKEAPIFAARMQAYVRALGADADPFMAVLDRPNRPDDDTSPQVAAAFALALPVHLHQPGDMEARMWNDCLTYVRWHAPLIAERAADFAVDVRDLVVEMSAVDVRSPRLVRGYIRTAEPTLIDDILARIAAAPPLSGARRDTLRDLLAALAPVYDNLQRLFDETKTGEDARFYLDRNYGGEKGAALALLQQSQRNNGLPPATLQNVAIFTADLLPAFAQYTVQYNRTGPLLAHILLQTLPPNNPRRWMTLSNPLLFRTSPAESSVLFCRWLSHAGYDAAFLDPRIAHTAWAALLPAQDTAFREALLRLLATDRFARWDAVAQGEVLLYGKTLEKMEAGDDRAELFRRGVLHRAALLEAAATIDTTALAGMQPTPLLPRFNALQLQTLEGAARLMTPWRNLVCHRMFDADSAAVYAPLDIPANIDRGAERSLEYRTTEAFFKTYKVPGGTLCHSHGIRALATHLAASVQDTLAALADHAPFVDSPYGASLRGGMQWFSDALRALHKLPGREIGRPFLRLLASTGPLWLPLVPQAAAAPSTQPAADAAAPSTQAVADAAYPATFALATAGFPRESPVALFVDREADHSSEAVFPAPDAAWLESGGAGRYRYPATILPNVDPAANLGDADDAYALVLAPPDALRNVHRPLYDLDRHWRALPAQHAEVARWYRQTSKRLTETLAGRRFSRLVRKELHHILPLTSVLAGPLTVHDLCAMTAYLSLQHTTAAPLQFGRVFATLSAMICDTMLVVHQGFLPPGPLFHEERPGARDEYADVIHLALAAPRTPKMLYRSGASRLVVREGQLVVETGRVLVASFLKAAAMALFAPPEAGVDAVITETLEAMREEGGMVDLRRITWHAAEMATFYAHVAGERAADAQYFSTAPSCLCLHEAFVLLGRAGPRYTSPMWSALTTDAAAQLAIPADVLPGNKRLAAALLRLAQHLLEAEMRVLMSACNADPAARLGVNVAAGDTTDSAKRLHRENTFAQPTAGIVYYGATLRLHLVERPVVTKAFIPETAARLFSLW